MTFINPTIEEIYKIISGNDELIDYLKDNKYLITNAMLYDTYTLEEIKEMQAAIKSNNIEMLYNLAAALSNYSEEIKSNELWALTSNKVAFKEIAAAFGLEEEDFSLDAYRQIIYTYKFCYVSSFFQNNKETFLPEYDFNFIEDTPTLKAFVDAMSKEFDKLDTLIGECLKFKDFETIPYDLINYLTQLLGFEKATFDADDKMEEKFREIAKNILDIYRVKGTNFSFELLFKFIGYNIQIKEFYFDRRLYYTSGNIHTNTTDKKNVLFYMSVDSPASNNSGAATNELVNLSDFTPQYSLEEFTQLANDYGPEAVLGYSKVDKFGKEYTGKIYKYFKTNLVYYIVSLDKANPNEKQLQQINKILEFLIPAYIIRTTSVNVYTGSSSNSPSDNMIFFDDTGRDPADNNNTLVNLEAELGDSEEDYNYIRNVVRNEHPIMLDSEIRDDFMHSGTGRSEYIIEGSNPPETNNDNGEVIPYVNSINTSSWKPKVPMKFVGHISLNRYTPTDTASQYFDFIRIRRDVKSANAYEDISVTDDPIGEYAVSGINYVRTCIPTLTKIEEFSIEGLTEEEKTKLLTRIHSIFDVCLEVEDLNTNNYDKFLNPYDFLGSESQKLIDTKFLLIKANTKFVVYRYGSVLDKDENVNNNYSFNIRLSKLQKLHRSSKKVIDLNVPTDKKKSGIDLETLYKIANGTSEEQFNPLDAIKFYYYDIENNEWYFPLRKASLITYSTQESGNYRFYKKNDTFLPSETPFINTIFKKTLKDEFEQEVIKYGGTSTSLNYNTIEDYLDSINVTPCNNLLFFIQDLDDQYNSDLYIYKNTYREGIVYSTADKKLYLIDCNGYRELKNFFGRVEIDGNAGKLYEHDDAWGGWNEIDDNNNFIFYNNEHKIIWENLGYGVPDEQGIIQEKIISRPIKAATDTEVTGDIKDKLIFEIFYSTYPHFSEKDKKDIMENELGAGTYRVKTDKDLLEKIKTNGVNEGTPELIEEKYPVGDKDIYGNYRNNYELFYDFITAEDVDEFLKLYYYNKLTKLYREAFFQDMKDQNDYNLNISDFDRAPIYETLNGNMGKFGKFNNLLQSYVNDNSLTVPYELRNSPIYPQPTEDSKLIVSKEDLLKANLLKAYYDKNAGNALKFKLLEIFNITIVYGTRSVFVSHPTFEYSNETNELIIDMPIFGGVIPPGITNGKLQINNTPQTLADNKINKHESKYLEVDEEELKPFVTNGDDRLISVKGGFCNIYDDDRKPWTDEKKYNNGGIRCHVEKIEGKNALVLDDDYNGDDYSFTDLDYVEIMYEYNKKNTIFKKFYPITFVDKMNASIVKDISVKDVEINFNTELSNLVVKKQDN